MAEVLMIAGKPETIFKARDFEYLVEKYMGYEAAKYFREYYKAGNSRVAYNHTAVTTAVWWGLRSPTYTNGDYFVVVWTGGSNYNYSAYYSGGLRPGFAA